MSKLCPHCGARLPITNDAFCSDCRGELAESPDNPLHPDTTYLLTGIRHVSGRHASEYFTIPGRVLVISALVLAVAGPWLVILWLRD